MRSGARCWSTEPSRTDPNGPSSFSLRNREPQSSSRQTWNFEGRPGPESGREHLAAFDRRGSVVVCLLLGRCSDFHHSDSSNYKRYDDDHGPVDDAATRAGGREPSVGTDH